MKTGPFLSILVAFQMPGLKNARKAERGRDVLQGIGDAAVVEMTKAAQP